MRFLTVFAALVPLVLFTPAAHATTCSVDGDCLSSEWCQASNGTCQAKLTNGSMIPTDPGHSPTLNGTCTVPAGVVVCASAVCDTADNRCGDADFHGPCTQGNGGVVCRSGACSVSGVCEPAGGCVVDADCSGSQWCNESAGACMAKIANGGAIPSDPPHTSPTLNGTCTPAVGALVCASGVCDVSDNSCGFANGDGPCSQGNGATVCRSGVCSQNGDCEPAGGCLVDADCPSGDVCAPGNVCVPVATPTPTATPAPTATPDGFVPPDSDTLKCEKTVGKALGKLGACIRTCRLKEATAALKGAPFDLAGCETTTPVKSCRAKYDAASQKLLGKGICPACLDGAHQSVLADRVVDEAESETRDLYCSGTVPLP
ncbi:MAG TPA: hypothetical protein VGK30_17335 [Candidatus Binatia bacterium]|jgi:hypothetical protein